MGPSVSPKALERRRRHAVAFLPLGLSLYEVAWRMRASVRTVLQWRNAWRQGGDVGLAPKPALGRPRKLIDAQHHQLLNPVVVRWQSQRFPQRAVNFETHRRSDSGPVWGTLSPAHIWRFLRSLGWSCQASERRSIQGDEQAIAKWKRYQWPAINKSARLGAHLTFLDESGFLLMPIRPNTWAPAGHSLIISYHDKHDRISTLAALTVPPKRQPPGLYLRFYSENFQAVDVADYLWVRLRHLRGRIVRLWERGAVHKGPVIEAVCQSHPRLHVEAFPACALELNPTEQVWNDFKAHNGNSLLRDTRELCRSLQTNVRWIRR